MIKQRKLEPPSHPCKPISRNPEFDGFLGKLTSGKWAKIAKCSSDTALNDINDLIAKGVLVKNNEGGRSTNYSLAKLHCIDEM